MADFHERMRYFNKRILNPFMINIAGRRFSPIAIVRHTGRKSGKQYETPIIVKPIKGGFMLALTYGSNVDWYRNLLEARGGSIRWNGRDYDIDKPEPVSTKRGIRVFPSVLQPILRLNKTSDFARVNREAAEH